MERSALWRLEMVRYRQPARLLSFVACLQAGRLARESHFALATKRRGAGTAPDIRRTTGMRSCIIPYRSLYSRVRHAYAHSKLLLLLFGDGDEDDDDGKTGFGYVCEEKNRRASVTAQ